MAQKLIVEGNDAIVLSQLCKLRGLNTPLGYEVESKYKKEFISNAGGYEKALDVLKLAIKKPDLANIGIIVDANDAGPAPRWQAIRSILADIFDPETLEAADKQQGAKIVQEANLPTVGVWIMPNNTGHGYLEHFLAELVPVDGELWSHAKQVIDELRGLPFNEISAAKLGKALIHTWLAWKEDPGKPFGQAMQAGYFNTNHQIADAFVDWFGKTFELSK